MTYLNLLGSSVGGGGVVEQKPIKIQTPYGPKLLSMIPEKTISA